MTSKSESVRRSLTGSPLVKAPGTLRAWVRSSEIGLVLLAALVGCLAGLAVSGMGWVAQRTHEALFGLEAAERLSAAPVLHPLVALGVPALGGVILAFAAWLGERWRRVPGRPVVDPIEANALHGGRLSLRDSVLVAVQNVISNGCGASVGLEAGYTQIAAGIASRLGLSFELRRSDMRVLVGCAAAAAIAAAFGAPLTGAFYAFELIIGTYAIGSLTPVVTAALAGAFVARAVLGVQTVITLGPTPVVTPTDYLPTLGLGLICAGLGILIMQGVTLIEAGVRRTRLPALARPALGGLLVGALALLATPQVLSAGHGALHLNLGDDGAAPGAGALIALFLAKALASAVSIGTGFRGGLFFASLLLGVLAGKVFVLLAPPLVAMVLPPATYAIVGMSALAVAVIGGPMTMTFLALEITGDFPITGLVLVAVIASSMAVRKTFGYSFATWRFHLRGESIRSAHDIGWIRSLTVGQLMRRDVRTVRADATLAAFRRAFPLGSASQVVALDEGGLYAGIVLVPEAHAVPIDDDVGAMRVADILRYRGEVLLPQMNAKEAVALFDRAESEALAVVEDRETARVIGLLSEKHTLRRYSEELDRQRRASVGEVA
ncbi:Voltage-gated ClC-type chloride channel ClcB [Methylobacterium crusticola]|uniref:Voltage-gated ClC-type chloride channel ClcB n=1 Tax=Methylobacterium crusticola TaxID=1697972 RepID=A0ABQ4R0N8_9HYPH|nr:chloride channel protein [Methylobacterium crusticola]GJD50675.1 Voltage-gated ClC-type chloride channel ClcB [Methylobacterium crusticola]